MSVDKDSKNNDPLIDDDSSESDNDADDEISDEYGLSDADIMNGKYRDDTTSTDKSQNNFYKPLKGTIFGENMSVPMDKGKALNSNVCVFGTSGTGKTYSFIEPNILQMDSNYVVADAKGDILRDIGEVLLRYGYHISVLNLNSGTYSMCYNPFDYIKSSDDIHYVASCLLANISYASYDDYWKKSAMQVLEALIAFVYEALPKEEQTLNTVTSLFSIIQKPISQLKTIIDKDDVDIDTKVRAYLNHSDSHNYSDSLSDDRLIGDALFDYYGTVNNKSYAVEMWRTAYSTVSKAQITLGGILSNLATALAPFEMPWIKNIINANDFNFSNMLKPKTAFFILYDDHDKSKSFLTNIFYNQLIQYLYHKAKQTNGKLPYRVRFILDDFYNINLPDFENDLSTARSRNISYCIILQNENQLFDKYGAGASGTIIGNCYAYLFTGTTDLHSAEIETERFNMTSQKIRSSSTGTFLLDIAGNLVSMKRYDWKKHPALKGFDYKPYLLKNHIKKLTTYTYKKHSVHPLKEYLRNMQSSSSTEQVNENLEPTDSLPRLSKPKNNHLFDSVEETNYYSFLQYFINKLGYLIFPHISLNNLIYGTDMSVPQSIKNNLMSVDFCICNKNYAPAAVIEIDGYQHRTDKKQILNDIYKDCSLFYAGLPVFRLKASYSKDYKQYVTFAKVNDIYDARKLKNYRNIKAFCSALRYLLMYKDSCRASHIAKSYTKLPKNYLPYVSYIFYRKSIMQSAFNPKFIGSIDDDFKNINDKLQMESLFFDNGTSLNNKINDDSKKLCDENLPAPLEKKELDRLHKNKVPVQKLFESDKYYHNRLAKNKLIKDEVQKVNDNRNLYKKCYLGGLISRADVKHNPFIQDLINKAFKFAIRNKVKYEFKKYIIKKPSEEYDVDVYSADGQTLYARIEYGGGFYLPHIPFLGDNDNDVTPGLTTAGFDFLCSFDNWSEFPKFESHMARSYATAKRKEKREAERYVSKRYIYNSLSREDIYSRKYDNALRRAFSDCIQANAFDGYVVLERDADNNINAYNSDGDVLLATCDSKTDLSWKHWHLKKEFLDFICSFNDWRNELPGFDDCVSKYL